MEYFILCVLIAVWALIWTIIWSILITQFPKELISTPAINDLKPDVSSGYPQPEAELAIVPDIKIPGNRYDSSVNKPAVNLDGYRKLGRLPVITEDVEGEDYVAQIDQLTLDLAQANASLLKMQTASLGKGNKATQSEIELESKNKELQQQISELLADKNLLTEKIAEDAAEYDLTIKLVTSIAFNRFRKLEKKLKKLTTRTEKPITESVGCGTDVQLVNVATQMEPKTVKDVGCGWEEILPPPNTILQTPTDYGFELDTEAMIQFSNQPYPFCIPANAQPELVVDAVPKSEVTFVTSDIRYRNKPISGYVVKADGTMVTYGNAVKVNQKPMEIIPETTEPAKPVALPILDQRKETRPISNLVKKEDLIVTCELIEPFRIPANAQPELVVEAVPKAEVTFATSDIRYKNKPISGYVVNSDGTMVTYSNVVKINQKPMEIIPETKPVDLPILNQQKETRPISDLVKKEDFIVISAPIERELVGKNKLLLKNIRGDDYGRIIGYGGANVRRIRNEFNVQVSVNEPINGICSLVISGNAEEILQKAADDIVQDLQATIECPELKNTHRIKNWMLKKINLEFCVKIKQPTDTKNRITITGKLKNCRSAYGALIAELCD